MEASKERRDKYLEKIKYIVRETIVYIDVLYIDESGIEVNSVKERGWGKIGQKLGSQKSGKYYERTNIIAGLVGNKSIAPFVFNGSCNTQVFENWVEQFLIKELKNNYVVIMDNASFHKSQKTKDLIESVGCKIISLPAYSPDLNPIEKFGLI